MTFNPEDYPLLSANGHSPFSIEPNSLFRIENSPFPVGDHHVMGNAILFFTGTMSSNVENDSTLLHCLPMYFYGPSAAILAPFWQDKDLWVEVVRVNDNDTHIGDIILN